MDEVTESSVKALKALIEEGTTLRFAEDGTHPFIVLRNDQKIEDAERFNEAPSRKRGDAKFARMESFIRYVNTHKEKSSAIYTSARTLTAVLNHHGSIAEWGDFRATYQMAESPQWKLWTASNAKKFGQKDFGQLIEDNLEDIADPASAELLEMVRQFEATSSVEYKGFDRGTDGNYAVSFVQTTQTKAGQKGTVELPSRFTLNIPAFEGGAPEPIVAKLRFSIDGGRLCLWYELQRIQQILDRHIENVVSAVEDQTGIEPFYGTP